MPKDSGPFRTGQKVLVPHTDKYYTAKCLKADKREDGIWYYLCHYQGWNKSFDEWIEQQGLVAFDPELAKVNLGKDEPVKEKPKRSDKKRKAPGLGPWDGDQQDSQVQVVLPPLLQKTVLNDRDQILDSRELHPLPARQTVAKVLQQFARAADTGTPDSVRQREEVAAGIQIYFDKALQQHLLYEEEQQQASQVLAHDVVPSCVYGPVHLLRLLCKLPTLVPVAQIKEDDRSVIEEQLVLLIAYLKQHHAVLFEEGGDTPQEQHNS